MSWFDADGGRQVHHDTGLRPLHSLITNILNTNIKGSEIPTGRRASAAS